MSTYKSKVKISPGNSTGFEDFVMLARANKLITDKYSTYSFWAGFFSVGSEVHLDVVTQAGDGGLLKDKRYVYHDESKSKYFGTYHSSTDEILYMYHGDKVATTN